MACLPNVAVERHRCAFALGLLVRHRRLRFELPDV
jgi:hypothetical protein